MKKVLILTALLLSGWAYSQNTTIHFYGASAKILGGEIMFNIRGTESLYLGGGFSGATSPDRTANHEKWCSLYAVGSTGYLGPVMVKYKAGLAAFTNADIAKVDYRPLAGIGAMVALTKDFGLEIGYDTFNNASVGFTVFF